MSEKMREEFDAWTMQYGFDDVEHMWQAWQASRAALVVELPQKPYCAQGMAYPDYSDALNDCREAIESVGVKCK